MKAPKAKDELAQLSHRLRNQDRRMSEAHRLASIAARADRTDPFTYNRIFSRVMNGVGEEFKFGDGQ